jgi:ubiquinone/menaquinone biosynthesis C-methylase UbiE
MSFFARMWRKAAPDIDARGGKEYRARMVQGLSGTVVEVGAGLGSMFEHYPEAVQRVVAVEPDPMLREDAVKAAGPRIEVSDGVAERLPLGDGEADAVVFALVLCTVPDPAAALAEARRVLKPNGEIRFWEHVIADSGFRRGFLKVADRSGFWPAVAGGCHPARDTLGAIRAAGFTVADVDEFDFRPSPIPPDLPWVLGRATP